MLKKISIDDKKVPFVFLFLLIASFGLLIPKLGFYWDDWPVIFMAQNQGIKGFWDFYQYDRPFSAWTYIVSVPVLGVSLINWHIFSLLLRWGTVIFLWLSLNKIWENKSRQIFWIALLFSVYPLFGQQSIAVAYSQHWTCYLFYFISVYLMLVAQERKGLNYYLLIISSAFLNLVQMLTMEYFIGLELFRPIILWAYYSNRDNTLNTKKLLRKTFSSGWIYIFLLGLYIIWRVFFLNLAGNDPNDPVFLKELIHSPIQSFLHLLQVALQDLIYFFITWFTTINPINIDLGRPFFIASTGVAVVTAFLIWLALNRYTSASQVDSQINKEEKWYRQAILFGIIAALFGTFPVWAIGRQASLGLYGNRFGLAAMFGLSIALVGLLEWLSDRTNAKNVLVCVLIGLAIPVHLYTAKDFQESWEKQQRVYWQLFWRAPYIDPGTAIISDGEIFRYVGNYSTAMGISLLYPPTENPQEMAYWFFNMGRNLGERTEELVTGTPLTDNLRNYSFEGSSKNILILYLPGDNQCTRILTASDANDKDIPAILRPVIPISNLDRIQRDTNRDWTPPEAIFGKEPEHTWCYYYEKADLARQFQDWEGVLTAMDNAQQQGFSPENVKEYMPWVEAFLYTNQNDKAYTLTKQMKKLSSGLDDQICRTWLNVMQVKPSDALEATYEKVKEELSCFD